MLLKIGELSKRTGVTIRALRHYDEIGLLSPSARSEGGFRLYGPDDVGKLYRIQALIRLNLSLTEIQQLLTVGGAAFPDVVEKQIVFLNHQISHAAALRDHLTELQSRHRQSSALAMDDWLGALAQMSAVSRYFNDDERDALATQRASVKAPGGDEKAALVAALQRFMTQGVAADSDDAQELGYRWIQLLMKEVGGDEGLLMKYYAMQWNEESLQMLSGIDHSGMTYISHAMAYRRLKLYAKYCSRGEIEILRHHYVRCTTSWPPLIAAIRSHMAEGTEPDDPDMQRLAKEWTQLESRKVGGAPGLAAKLQHAFTQEPALRFGSGIDEPFLDYLNKALQALQKKTINNKTRAAP
ncbi:MAG TPA: MerR family transcriptional regulator [Noviherbaspirillum sp.]|jgi:DNA-binding transcriptional MerR regulator|uniref:MerR family transcriptional regulator n=1 Tax=Noviherbaspirillum sp. TaxID=1926288 RepID=UPI002DDC9969|nr:MerR family transcriptional regulator [Noviherbaspirillum sp.]HEV2608681.1 MerR family transcriptional regulator [Noviherbaspirillum sp.]